MKTGISRFLLNKGLAITAMFVLINLTSCNNDGEEPKIKIKDVDGNVYTSVKIGTQVWMVENLKVTKYRNGDPIPDVSDQSAWADLTTGGYCNQSNETGNAAVYGRLYNWYAATDSRGIAPEGWHIPTDAEWTTLTEFLGGENIAGGKLKESGAKHWCDPNTGATNASCFMALPGGARTNDLFLPGCEWGMWWTTTEAVAEPTTGYNRIIFDSDVVVNRVNNNKKYGMSVRCVKD